MNDTTVDAMDAAFDQAGITDADFEPVKASPPAENSVSEPEDEAAPTPSEDDGEGAGQKAAETDEEKAPAKADAPEKPGAKAEEKKPISEAPSRFSADAKAAWKDAPEAVRGEINRAMAELEGGLQQYQKAFEPLKPFAKMAQDGGTTLPEALKAYVSMEEALRLDPIKGFGAIAQKMGIDLKAIASEILGVGSDGQPQPDAAKDREITGLKDQVSQLMQTVQQLQSGAQTQMQESVQRQIDAFRAANPRFDELEHVIAAEIEAGHTLEQAYQRAVLLNPAPQPAPAPQKPAANLATHGAPASGSNPPRSKTPPKDKGEHLDLIFAEVGIT